jgi:2-polyprenyl-3-methyl-5-hydroxy-6-metoxy-1,4-benzoquinol methylase
LQPESDTVFCACGWRREARDGVLDLVEALSDAEAEQRRNYDQQQLGAVQTSDPYRSFVSPAGLRLTQMLRRLRLQPGQTFLEIACAAGPLSDALATNCGARGVAIDLSPASIARQMLRRGNRVHYDAVVASAHDLPLHDSNFDAVTAFDVVEHLEKPEQLYNEVARVLKPGGRLLLRCPVLDFGLSLDWWQNLLTPRRWKRRMDAAGHFYENFRTKAQHRAMAEAAGLRVLYWTGYDVFWDNFIEYMLLPALSRMRKRGGSVPAVMTEAGGPAPLRVPQSLPHRLARLCARMASVALLPERALGRLGMGASMWLLAEKPTT